MFVCVSGNLGTCLASEGTLEEGAACENTDECTGNLKCNTGRCMADNGTLKVIIDFQMLNESLSNVIQNKNKNKK